jgi:LPXTG-motif cell wall-anchored protein
MLGLRLGARSFLCVSVALVSTARAETPASANIARAEGLFQSGRQLMREGRFAEACPKLEESQRLDPAPGTRLNLADCWERAGRTASAQREFLEVAQSAEMKGEKERAAIANNRAKQLETKLTKLTLLVPPAARLPGLQLFRNAALVPETEWGEARAVDPGAFVIEARAPGRRTFKSAFTLHDDAATHNLTIPTLAAESAATGPPPADAATTRGLSLQRGGMGLAGLGAVGLALGTVLGVRAVSLYHQSQDEGCDQHDACPAAALKTRSSAVQSGDASTVSFVVGGILLAGGAGLYVWGTKERSSERAALSMHITPQAGGGFLSVDSTF